MANSASNLDLILQAQASKEVTSNGLSDAASPAMTYGRRQSTCRGRTWGFYGGNVTLSSGTMSQIANGTLTLTASATNYIVANKATGAVSFSTATTNWNDSANYWRLYSVVVGAATVTSYIDSRELAKYTGGGGGGGGGGTWGGITGTLSDQTDLQSAINLKANAASPNTSGTLTHSGDITVTGTARRITGDFSNDTVSNRLMLQSSTVGGISNLGVMPNGTGVVASFVAFNSSDPDNASTTVIQATATQSRLIAGKNGTGTYKPLTLNVGGADVATYSAAAATLGNMTASVNRNSSLAHSVTNGDAGASANSVVQVVTNAGSLYMQKTSVAGGGASNLYTAGGVFNIGTTDAQQLRLKTNNTDRVWIGSTGNVGIGAENVGTYGKFTLSGTGYQAITVVDSEASGAVGSIVANGTFNVNVGSVSNHNLDLVVKNAPRLRMDTVGNSLHVSPTGGLGYGAGAGGSATQTTSKSTTVPLNRPCGLIIMHPEALEAGASVLFTMTNSVISTFDGVIVSQSGYGLNYRTEVASCYGGTCIFRVTNVSAGSRSEAVELNFQVIKGSNL